MADRDCAAAQEPERAAALRIKRETHPAFRRHADMEPEGLDAEEDEFQRLAGTLLLPRFKNTDRAALPGARSISWLQRYLKVLGDGHSELSRRIQQLGHECGVVKVTGGETVLAGQPGRPMSPAHKRLAHTLLWVLRCVEDYFLRGVINEAQGVPRPQPWVFKDGLRFILNGATAWVATPPVNDVDDEVTEHIDLTEVDRQVHDLVADEQQGGQVLEMVDDGAEPFRPLRDGVEALPDEVLMEVFVRIGDEDAKGVLLTCKRFSRLFESTKAVFPWAPDDTEDTSSERIGRLAPSLRKLVVHANDPDFVLPPNIGRLTELREIVLTQMHQDCAVGALDGIVTLTKVTCIRFTKCQFARLPELGHLPLRELDVDCPQVRELPHSISTLTQLTRLRFRGLTLSLPDMICELPHLAELDIQHLAREARPCGLPPAISKLTALTSLQVNFAHGNSVAPDVLGHLARLKVLHLHGMSLPFTASCLVSLTRLNLHGMEVHGGRLGGLGLLADLTFGGYTAKNMPRNVRDIARLTALTRLKLDRCGPDLLSAVSSLPRLVDLDVGSYGSEQVPDAIGQLTAVTSLSISSKSPVLALPNSFGNLRSLAHLSLGDVHNLPTTMWGLTRLTHMRVGLIRRCHSGYVRPKVGLSPAIMDLEICNGRYMHDVGDDVCRLGQLTRLHLKICDHLNSLPNAIGNLRALEELEVVSATHDGAPWRPGLYRYFRHMPSTLGELGALTKLRFEHCDILRGSLVEFGRLSALVQLDLIEMLVWKLPDELCNLQALTRLHLLACTELTALPREVGKLTALREVSLAGCCKMSELPAGACDLRALQKLDLSRCRTLQRLPERLGCLLALRELKLEACWQVGSLPEGIGRLSSLKCLDLTDCSGLSGLPNTMGDLSALEELRMSGCTLIKRLPACMKRLKRVHTFHFVEHASRFAAAPFEEPCNAGQPAAAAARHITQAPRAPDANLAAMPWTGVHAPNGVAPPPAPCALLPADRAVFAPPAGNAPLRPPVPVGAPPLRTFQPPQLPPPLPQAPQPQQQISAHRLFTDPVYTAAAATLTNASRQAWQLLLGLIWGAYTPGITEDARSSLEDMLDIVDPAHVRRMCSAWNAMADHHGRITAYPAPAVSLEQARVPGGVHAQQTHDELSHGCANAVHAVLQAVQAAAAVRAAP